mmetsp:Transcript_72613/g.146137  ORF Transcript_72613/g.146137 Transcript_72613/m.146137 type:complete len:89 (+) Transcript_72613:206-472(+)
MMKTKANLDLQRCEDRSRLWLDEASEQLREQQEARFGSRMASASLLQQSLVGEQQKSNARRLLPAKLTAAKRVASKEKMKLKSWPAAA